MEKICQSCGMPIKDKSMQSEHKDYCVYCFKNGKFTFEGTYKEFLEKQVKIAIDKLHLSEEKARKIANKILPNLKRWNSK